MADKPAELRPSRPSTLPFVCALAAFAVALLVPTASGALISSTAGPLTHVWVSNELECQVEHVTDGSTYEFYESTTAPGDCATFLAAGGTLYTPSFPTTTATSFPGATIFTPVSQTAVTGAGTATSPYQIVTVADAGTSGLRLQETDTYTTGSFSYHTDIKVTNLGTSASSMVVYHAGDCYLGASDAGYGALAITAAGSVACTINANNAPPGRYEELIPRTTGSRYMENNFSAVWSWINGMTGFPNTCVCTSYIDNGAGLSWSLTIAAGSSATVSLDTKFNVPPKTPLTPAFTVSGTGCYGDWFTFKDTTTGGFPPYTVSWNFGDSPPGTATGATATYKYAAYGTYTVTETVTDVTGATLTTTRTVTVTHCPPTGSIQAFWSCPSNVVHLVAAVTTYGGANVTNVTWNLGDGSSASGTPVDHAYALGTYTVTANVTDSYGNVGHFSLTITIAHCAPTGSISAPTLVCVDELVKFTAVVSTTDGAGVVNDSWNFGDGVGYGSPVTHKYTAPGTYTVTVVVTDSMGASSTFTTTVTVRACDHTWAMGDLYHNDLWVAGNDPTSCGFGVLPPPGAVSASQVDAYNFSTGPKPEPSLNSPRFLGAAATIAQPTPTLVVVGGANTCALTTPLGTSEYIQGTTAWSLGPTLSPRVAPAAAADNTTMWVAGGDDKGLSPSLVSSVHRPTPSFQSNTVAGVTSGTAFATLPNMPAGVIGASALWDPVRQRVVVGGGYTHPQVQTSLVQTYDPQNNSWDGPNLPDERTGHNAVECGREAWVLGGFTGYTQPMYAYAGAPTSTTWHGSTGTWTAGPAFPGYTPAYAQAASSDDQFVFVTGGAFAQTGALASKYFFMDCAAGTPWLMGSIAPTAAGFANVAEGGSVVSRLPLSGSVSTSPAGLTLDESWYIIGGTTSKTTVAGPSGRIEGGCPTDKVWRMSVNQARTLTAVPQAVAPLPVPTAAMGAVTLPDGRIFVAGGRISNAAHTNCYIPTNRTWVYDPLLNQWFAGPNLPKPLIAPAILADGYVVTVYGGDDQGDQPSPATVWNTMPRRPSTDVYSVNLVLWLPEVGVPTVLMPPLTYAWVPQPPLAMGVVWAQAAAPTKDLVDVGPVGILGTGTVFVIGGNQAPLSAVRLVQQQTTEGVLAKVDPTRVLSWHSDWSGIRLPAPMAHFGFEICPDDAWIAYDGTRQGPVYWEQPVGSALSKETWVYPVDDSGWAQTADQPLARAFPVGHSIGDWYYATGTVPGAQRTHDISHHMCSPDLPPHAVPPPVTKAKKGAACVSVWLPTCSSLPVGPVGPTFPVPPCAFFCGPLPPPCVPPPTAPCTCLGMICCGTSCPPPCMGTSATLTCCPTGGTFSPWCPCPVDPSNATGVLSCPPPPPPPPPPSCPTGETGMGPVCIKCDTTAFPVMECEVNPPAHPG